MTHSLTITLDADTFGWLTRQATAEQSSLAAVVEELLRELADPENVEGDLMDRLLLQSVDFFPTVMTLEEQDEHRDEIIDYLCGRIVQGFQQRAGDPLSESETDALRKKLVERSQEVWPSR